MKREMLILCVCLFLVLTGCGTKKQSEISKNNVDTEENNYVENKEMTLTFSDGTQILGIYTGATVNGIPDGSGTFVNEKWTYTGGWKQGSMDGIGFCKVGNGEQYEGTFWKGA